MALNISQLLTRKTLIFDHKTHEIGDVWTFYFKKKDAFKHIAGQHGIFTIKNGGFHIFSLANAPTEDFVMIGTHVRSSKFKQALDALQPGDEISFRGPMLNFTLENVSPQVVFIAQGIGITPFRSMLQAGDTAHQKTLLAIDASSVPYASELAALADDSYFVQHREAFTQQLSDILAKHGNNATYYVSGSGDFNKSTKAFLTKNGITKSQIKADLFLGY